VTGSIILVIGISLMRVGVGWAMGGPAPMAQNVDVPKLVAMVDGAKAAAAAAAASAPAGAAPVAIKLPGPIPMVNNPAYGALDHLAVAAAVLLVILLLVKYARGFVSNIAVLLGIVAGCVMAVALGKMNFDKVAKAGWFDVVTPFAFGMPTFDPVMILTMTLVMIVVMIESTGMFLALSDMTGRRISQSELAAGLRTDGLGTLIGGVFNTFPYTSFSQNVGLVGVTGVRSRWVCVTGGLIMIGLGLLPKMAALVESVPTFVLGGAGLVMFGMVAATGIRILSTVDYKGNRYNLYIVALSIGVGLVPLVAPRWMQQMAHSLHPLLESGILLTAVAAVALNLFFNGARGGEGEAVEAAKLAEAH
ncbi:MAG: solute carrier family 23 protein, partial [Rubrivivax sp.]